MPPPDLLVWPETSYLPDFPWWESSPRLPLRDIPDGWRRKEVEIHEHMRKELLKGYPLNHLLGLNSYVLTEHAKGMHYNSALLVRKNGNFAGRYDKIHRVPFGEYVPLRAWMPFLQKLTPYDFDYSIEAGEKSTRFELGKYRFGVLICYEDTDSRLARHYVKNEPDGPPVDFLVNISNDGWFNGTSEHDEHLAISRFRAIECRRALARAVNMGISAVIDGNGRVLQPQELPPPGEPHTWKIYDDQEMPDAQWPSLKKTAGILLAHVPIDTRESFYARTGDWLPYGCWAVLGATMAWALVRRRRDRKVPATATA
jgi:apolipoprotein N-acyltransferase